MLCWRIDVDRIRSECIWRRASHAGAWKQVEDAKAKIVELQFLLRQVFYARHTLGMKFNEDLDTWSLTQFEQRIEAALKTNG